MLKKIKQYALAQRLQAFVLAAVTGLLTSSVVAAAPLKAPLKVVASFSILGDMVGQIGGDHIALTTIVGPNGNVHSFEPRPSDAKALAQAQLLVVNGLNFEGWLPRLEKASGFNGIEVVASKGIVGRQLSEAELAGIPDHKSRGKTGAKLDESHPGEVDPHAWQSLSNGMIYARNIASALIKVDPGNAEDYRARAELYISEMKKLDEKLREALATIPADRRYVVTSHDAFGYFAREYGVQFISAMGISSDAEPSAKGLAVLIKQVKATHSSAVFLENVTNPKLIQQIARETGAQVGGSLYSDALDQPDKPAGTYLGMFKWNAGQLIYALKPEDQSKP